MLPTAVKFRAARKDSLPSLPPYCCCGLRLRARPGRSERKTHSHAIGSSSGSWPSLRAQILSTGDTVRACGLSSCRKLRCRHLHCSQVWLVSRPSTAATELALCESQTTAKRSHVSAAKIAVLSAQDNSPNLIPVLIFGGAHGSVSSEAQENLEWFRDHGGLIFHHNLTFGDGLQVSSELR